MKAAPTKRIELSMDELESILRRAQTSTLDEKDCAKIKAVFETYLYLTDLLEDKATTIDRLRKLLFGPGSEKTRDVIPPPAPPPAAVPEGTEPAPRKRPGHGRNGADAYEGAAKIPVPHQSLKTGDLCPECKKGKVYEVA
jgi:transposase